MTLIESEVLAHKATPEEIFSFLADVNQHQSIMPDQVVNWKSDVDTCQYTISGTGTISLKVTARLPNQKITMQPDGKVPFGFTMSWNISSIDGVTHTKLLMEAELNAMLRMLAAKPLENFLNLQNKNLQAYFENL